MSRYLASVLAAEGWCVEGYRPSSGDIQATHRATGAWVHLRVCGLNHRSVHKLRAKLRLLGHLAEVALAPYSVTASPD